MSAVRNADPDVILIYGRVIVENQLDIHKTRLWITCDIFKLNIHFRTLYRNYNKTSSWSVDNPVDCVDGISLFAFMHRLRSNILHMHMGHTVKRKF